jgi:hypothetical protein
MRARLLCLLGTSGCLMAGNYHTAKTLEKGTSQFGMTFSATQYTFHDTDSSGATTNVSVAIPNLLPELTYHIGVADNVEAGGRVALGSLGGEFDVKWRFVHDGKLHLAVAPAIGYQAFVIIEGGILRLPAILTYELADNFDFTAAAFGSVTHYKTIDSGNDFDAWSGTLTGTGGAIGFDLHGEVMSIRPAVEFTRFVWSSNGTDPFNVVNYMVHIAWTGGREKKQLDRIERKIDNLQPQPSPYPYPPGPYPQQPPPYAPPPPPPPAPPPAPAPEPPPEPPTE